MEILRIVLPNDILNKIRLYSSHPTADLIRAVLKSDDYDYECKRFRRKVGRELAFHEYVFQSGWENATASYDQPFYDREAKYQRLKQEEEWDRELQELGII